jgi:D-serine deaminase-like pyridoxal phosphate-dependent protein
MSDIAELPTPALLLDRTKLERNLGAMATRAESLGVALRPHIKTHKCIEIGQMQRSLGATGITVATLHEARAFADHGFDDITWAFPLVPSRVDEAMELASRVTLRIVVDSAEALAQLAETRFPFKVLIKIDCGYHRAGVDPHGALAVTLARDLHESHTMRFAGILTHSGHSYYARGREEIGRIAEEERRVMVEFSQRLQSVSGIGVPHISVGSTPALSFVEHLEGITEIRPGNYALYDYSQTVMGSCTVADCAATVLASVVSSQPGMTHCVIDAGALALSKDTGPADRPVASMGEIFDDYAAGTLLPETRVVSLSQEHGIVSRQLPVGSKVRILPNHSCLTVAQFDQFHVVEGDRVVDTWRIWRER